MVVSKEMAMSSRNFVDEQCTRHHPRDICISSSTIATPPNPELYAPWWRWWAVGGVAERAGSVVRVLPFLPHFWLSDVGCAFGQEIWSIRDIGKQMFVPSFAVGLVRQSWGKRAHEYSHFFCVTQRHGHHNTRQVRRAKEMGTLKSYH